MFAAMSVCALALSSAGSTFAQQKSPVAAPNLSVSGIADSVVVSNSGALLGSSVAVFAAGSKMHAKPEVYNSGPGPHNTDLEGAAGVAINPSTSHNFVASSADNLVLSFSPTANGSVPPEQLIVGLDNPDDVAFDATPIPNLDTALNNSGDITSTTPNAYVSNTLPPLCVSSSPCLTTSPDLCSIGSIEGFEPVGEFIAVPNTVIKGCSTLNFGPVGLYVDEATVHECTCTSESPSTDCATAADTCNIGNGNTVTPMQTRRIFATQRFGGFITVYEPEFAAALGITGADQPPVGGFISTALASGDATEPNFLATNGFLSVTSSGSVFYTVPTQLYVTDILGGHNRRGRVKTFNIASIANCLVTASDGTCEVANGDFLVAASATDIEGKHTRLSLPMGIAAQPDPDFDGTFKLFVTNVNSNSVVQFSNLDSGDARPESILIGGRTKLNQPAGIAAFPVVVPGAPPPSVAQATKPK
ncbi:MAG TPA: hypothetical protein VMV27_10860 [Candidatus Binataceae bacterium]|nr:hypothetical protein [Candidatus Binataceae bacterium]